MVNSVATTHLYGQKRCRRGDACQGISNNLKRSCERFFIGIEAPKVKNTGGSYYDISRGVRSIREAGGRQSLGAGADGKRYGRQGGLREDGGVDTASIFIFFHPKARHICYNNSNIVKF